MGKYVCIHGHFYQPPRENPWLETVEMEVGAAPYHDWNQRITAECYAPRRSRIDGFATTSFHREQLSLISFTLVYLLSWMKGNPLKCTDRSSRQIEEHLTFLAWFCVSTALQPHHNPNNQRIKGPKSPGGFKTSLLASNGSREGCGCLKPLSIQRRWKPWSQRE